jgi:hypothetical protein
METAAMNWNAGYPPIREHLSSFFLRYQSGKVGIGRYAKMLLNGHGASKFILVSDDGLMVVETVIGWMDVSMPSWEMESSNGNK